MTIAFLFFFPLSEIPFHSSSQFSAFSQFDQQVYLLIDSQLFFASSFPSRWSFNSRKSRFARTTTLVRHERVRLISLRVRVFAERTGDQHFTLGCNEKRRCRTVEEKEKIHSRGWTDNVDARQIIVACVHRGTG